MHEREQLAVTRIVTRPDAIDHARWPSGALVLRTAPDEVLVLGDVDASVADLHAIVYPDTGWDGFRVAAPNAALCMERTAGWPLPAEGFGQGMVAGIATKVWVGRIEVLFIVPSVVADEFERRIEAVWAVV